MDVAINRACIFTALYQSQKNSVEKLPVLFTTIHVIANTLKTQIITHALLIYTEILNRYYTLSILGAALDFPDCMSKENT